VVVVVVVVVVVEHGLVLRFACDDTPLSVFLTSALTFYT
jgi:hypothetical protein